MSSSSISLFSVCMDIAMIENGLAEGWIPFSYDNLMSAMKPGHPADILDDIFCDVGNTLYFDPTAKIPTERLQRLLSDLEEFKDCFNVDRLQQPIDDLKEYLAQ